MMLCFLPRLMVQPSLNKDVTMRCIVLSLLSIFCGRSFPKHVAAALQPQHANVTFCPLKPILRRRVEPERESFLM